MGIRIWPDPVVEGTSHAYSGQLVDQTGAAISGSSVTSLVATLRDLDSDTVINGRSQQNVLNQNGGSLSAGGLFTLQLGPLDAVIVAGGRSRQRRRLTLRVVYTTGELVHEVYYDVLSAQDR